MATYKEIHGVKVQYRDSDATAIEGDVWYNAGTGKLKMYASAGSWASGGTMNTARYYCAGAATSKDSALIAGGDVQATEQYNGTAWSEVADMAASAAIEYSRMPVGTATAALMAGGGSPYSQTVEQWDNS